MKEGIQKTLENIGKYGCGFLCICHIMGIHEDQILDRYFEAVAKGYMDTECYVKDWGKLATFLCPTWHLITCQKSDKKDPKAIFYLEYWYNPRTKLHHFKLPDYDPLGNSVTVKEGKIESYRNFYAA